MEINSYNTVVEVRIANEANFVCKSYVEHCVFNAENFTRKSIIAM